MTYQFINRQQIGDLIYWDLLLEDVDWSERVNGVVAPDNGEDREVIANQIYDNFMLGKTQNENKEEVVAAVETIKDRAYALIDSGHLNLSNILTVSNSIRASLATLGISLEAPDVASLLKLRILDTVCKVQTQVSRMTITDEAGIAALGVVTDISETLSALME